MRLSPAQFALILISLLILLSLASHGFFESLFSPKPDAIYPKPVVRLFVEGDDWVLAVRGNGSFMRELSDRLKLVVVLANNSSEPSLEDSFAAGVFFRFRGARVESYELNNFTSVIGIREGGELIDPINASMVEFFARKLPAWHSLSAEIILLRDNGSRCIEIAYRGWIMDEDDMVLEPVSGVREHYIARDPPENYPENPPDSRWAGKDFLKYKTYVLNICRLEK